MSGSGLIGRALGIRRAQTERDDVLAYLERRNANCALVAGRMPEFADEARVLQRQLEILIDEIRAGLHEGQAEVAALIAQAARGPYPFSGHRTVAEVDESIDQVAA